MRNKKQSQHTSAAKFAVSLLRGVAAELEELRSQPLIEWTLRGQQIYIDVSEGLSDLQRKYPELFAPEQPISEAEKEIIESLKKNKGQPVAPPPNKEFEDPLIRP